MFPLGESGSHQITRWKRSGACAAILADARFTAINAKDAYAKTALHWAAQTGRTEIAETLIYAGANLEAVTRLGDYTPMHLAGRNSHAGVLQVLLEAGGNPEAVTTSGGSTVLHFAAGSGNAEAVRALLAGGAQVNARESSRGQTPLMFASAAATARALTAPATSTPPADTRSRSAP